MLSPEAAVAAEVAPPPKIVNVGGFLPEKSCQEQGLWLALDCWMLPVHCLLETRILAKTFLEESFLPVKGAITGRWALGWKWAALGLGLGLGLGESQG